MDAFHWAILIITSLTLILMIVFVTIAKRVQGVVDSVDDRVRSLGGTAVRAVTEGIAGLGTRWYISYNQSSLLFLPQHPQMLYAFQQWRKRHRESVTDDYIKTQYPTHFAIGHHCNSTTINVTGIDRVFPANLYNSSWRAAGWGNETPLLLACYMRIPHITLQLIAMGANIHIPDATGQTPLHYAIRGIDSTDLECMGVVEKLLHKGAIVNEHVEWQRTTYAAFYANLQRILILPPPCSDLTPGLCKKTPRWSRFIGRFVNGYINQRHCRRVLLWWFDNTGVMNHGYYRRN